MSIPLISISFINSTNALKELFPNILTSVESMEHAKNTSFNFEKIIIKITNRMFPGC